MTIRQYDAKNGNKYQIQMHAANMFAQVYLLEPRTIGGALCNMLQDVTGAAGVTFDLCKIDDKEQKQIVLELGWNYSVSKVWKRTYSYWQRKEV